jgi:potassium efflux system protein
MFALLPGGGAGASVRIGLVAVALLVAAARPAGCAAGEAPSEPQPSASPGSEQLTPEAIHERLKMLETSADPNDPTAAAIRDLYGQAIPLLEAASKSAARLAEYERMIDSAPDDLKAIQEKLAALPSVPAIEVPAEATVSQLQQKLDEAKQLLEAAEQSVADYKARATRRVVAQKESAEPLAEARRQLAEVNRQLEAPASESDPPSLALAKRGLLLARRQALENEIAVYERELAAHAATKELFPFEQRLADAELSLAQERVARWQEIVNRRREEEARRTAAQAKAEAARADLSPALREIADANLELAEESETLAAEIKSVTHDLQDVDAKLGDVRGQFQRSQDRVETIGLTTEVGLLLRTRRATLPDAGHHRRAIRARQETILKTQLRLFELEDLRSLTSAKRRGVEVALAREGPPPAGVSRDDLDRAAELVKKQQGYLDELSTSYLSYLRLLVDVTESQRKLVELTEAYEQYIDELVLWIRSAEPLSPADGRQAAAALLSLVSPHEWSESLRDLARDALTDPAPFVLALVVFVPWIALQPALRRWLGQSGELAMRSTTYRIMPTLNSLLLTGLIALLWPCVLWYLAWRWTVPWQATDFAKAAGLGCSYAAWFVLPLVFFRQVCRPNGLAQAHFGWPRETALAMRRHLRWFVPWASVAVFLIGMVDGLGRERWQSSLGRLAFMTVAILAAILLHFLLRPAGGVFRYLGGKYGDVWPVRLRRLWHALGMLLPAGLAILAALGYHYTAEQVAKRMLATVYLPLGLMVVGGVLLRWILVVRRRLAIDRARSRLAAELAEAAPAGQATLPASPAPASEPDLSTISYQAGRLVQGVLLVGGLVGIWLIWVEILPALGFLRQIPLWHLSLADVGLALIFVILTVLAVRNVPGLLEIAMLHSLPLDSGARYAITTITRYVLAIVGLMLTCSVVGIQWSTVQWLVAAMGVGLGFGLQEIFANFVSGLIILFERPIRVGDIVTIEGVSGVVSRIHIRATYVTNWDRQEFIVPNKEFITGRLLNWTLGNAVNRVVINVGIAYGSDTERARELLLRIAREHPLVMSDPGPLVTFEGFGDSTLNFVLRCYLPNLDNRLGVIHELHTTIHREFNAAGIEIAFPQRDLHLRSGTEVLRDAFRERRAESPPDAERP